MVLDTKFSLMGGVLSELSCEGVFFCGNGLAKGEVVDGCYPFY